MGLTREQLLATRNGVKIEAVQTPSGECYVKTPTAGDLDWYTSETFVGGTQNNMRCRLVAICVCSQDGALLFARNELHEVASLPAPMLLPLFNAARRVAGLDDEPETMDNAAKN